MVLQYVPTLIIHQNYTKEVTTKPRDIYFLTDLRLMWAAL